MEHNDAIAWAVASGVWIACLALLLWLASRERRVKTQFLRWAGPRVAAGLGLWVLAFGATRWAEHRLGFRSESLSRPVRSAGAHTGSRAP
jgi:hypothetical protein